MSNGLPAEPCLVCSPRSCRRSWIYVVHDHTLGLTKIGKSVNVSQRLQSYRKGLKRDVRVHAKYQPTCDFLIIEPEEAAIALLPKALRVRGDWYRVPPMQAIDAVETVLGEVA